MKLFDAPNTAVERDAFAATRGTIFDIQRFSINDGPGIRTIVFFQRMSAALQLVRESRIAARFAGIDDIVRELFALRRMCCDLSRTRIDFAQ